MAESPGVSDAYAAVPKGGTDQLLASEREKSQSSADGVSENLHREAELSLKDRAAAFQTELDALKRALDDPQATLPPVRSTTAATADSLTRSEQETEFQPDGQQ